MFDGNNNIPTYLHRLLGATMTFLRKRGAIGITSETKQFQPYVEFDQYNCFELIKLLPIQLPNGEEGIFYKKDTQGRQIRFSNIKGEKYQEVDGQDFRQATSNTYGFDLIEGVYPFFTLKKLDTSDTKTAMHHMVNYDEELAFQRGLAYEKSSHLIQQVLDNNDIGNYLIKIMDSDTLKCFSATSKQYYDRTNAVQKDRKPVILRTRFDECFLNLMKNGNFAKSIESLDGFIFKPGCKEDLIHTWPFKVLSFMDNIETIKIHDIDVCDEDLADLEKEAELYKESKAPSSLRAISIYAVNLPIGRYEGSIEKALTMLTSNTPSLEKIVTLASFSSYKPGHKACLKTVILKKDNKETTMSADNVFWPTALTHFFKVLTNSKKNFKIELPDFYLTGEAERQLDPTGTPMEFACVPNDLDFNKGLYDTWLPTIKEGLKSNFDLDIEIVNIKGENLPTAVFTKIHTEGSKATA